MKNVKVKILFQTSRPLTQAEGLEIWGDCSNFMSAPGKRTYQITWRMTTPEAGKVTERDCDQAEEDGLTKLGALMRELEDITYVVLGVKSTKGKDNNNDREGI
jgi:hypothetical protein